VDIIQLHGIDDEATLQKACGSEGVLQTCREARREGFVNSIGITSHKPHVLVKAIESGEFDTVLVPLNVVTRQALEELVPTAKAHDVGVVVMKPLMAKTSKLITCLYNPSLSLLGDEPELNSLLGQDADSKVRSALRYVLSQDISVVIPGLRSIHEVEVAAKTGKEYRQLTEQEQRRFSVDLKEVCRDCGICLPCPEGIDVAAALRFHALAQAYALENWAKKLYSGLEPKINKCNTCQLCEQKCPYGLPVLEMLNKAHSELMPPKQ
jgi:predicted aldo/keto reductase-like oxidoreductase